MSSNGPDAGLSSAPWPSLAADEAVRSLNCEIQAAISAITSNSLPAFLESIARQEMLCALLADAVQHSPSQDADRSAGAQLHSEIRTLGSTMRTYNALLRRCAKSNALLIALCQSCAGTFRGAHAPSSRGRSLSCQV